VPKMGYLYSWWCRGSKAHYSLPKGIHSFINSLIHSSKFNTICNCTIQYLQKEQAISFLFIHDPKKNSIPICNHTFFWSDFYAKNKSRNLFLFIHSWPTTQ
jgi:hypothetical protein